MKRILFLLLWVVIIITACQTNTEMTDADKDAVVQAATRASKEYWALCSSQYDSETFNKFREYYDMGADQLWQPEPAAAVMNFNITSKQDEVLSMYSSLLESRITTTPIILKSHFMFLSKDKVLEVNKGDYTWTNKDGSVSNPFRMVNTIIWANIDGKWKIQFFNEIYGRKPE